MEFVVKDIGGDWYFENGTYWCVDKLGAKVAKMKLAYVPDFYEMWKSKCTAAGVDIKAEEGLIYKPSQVLKKISEHKHAYLNQ